MSLLELLYYLLFLLLCKLLHNRASSGLRFLKRRIIYKSVDLYLPYFLKQAITSF